MAAHLLNVIDITYLALPARNAAQLDPVAACLRRQRFEYVFQFTKWTCTGTRGSLAGCSAVVKTPYNAPTVQVPNSSSTMHKK